MKRRTKILYWFVPFVFTILMVFGMTATVNAATDVYTSEFDYNSTSGWEFSNDPITSSDLPRFKECSAADAKEWSYAPTDSKVWLIFQCDENSTVSLYVFENGAPGELLEFTNTKRDFFEHAIAAADTGLSAIYYTSSAQQILPHKSLYFGETQMLYEGETFKSGNGEAVLSGTSEAPVLTLTDFVYTHDGIDDIGDEDGGTIYYKGEQTLNVVLVGANEIKNECNWNIRKGNGIRLGNNASIVFKGSGKLNISSAFYGLQSSRGTITVNDGKVFAVGGWNGIKADQITVDGGVLHAESGDSEASDKRFGILSNSGSGRITVSDGSLIAKGHTRAIDSNLKVTNDVFGYGWDSFEGTGTRTAIPVGEEPTLDGYKKVVFGQEPSAFSGVDAGNRATAGTVPVDDKIYYEGDKVTVLGPGSLVKDDKDFLGWSTSSKATAPGYKEGDTFTMEHKDVILYAVWGHLHNFTYDVSDDGATITATCSKDGCPLTGGKATLTISAAGGKDDGKTTYGATITDENSIKGDAEINYYKANDDGTKGDALDPITAAPKNAGKYWAEITLGAEDNKATAHVVYSIAEADPAPKPAPAPTAASIAVNSKTVTAASLSAAMAKAGVSSKSVTTIVLDKSVKKISKGAFSNFKNATTLVVKTKKLKKSKVKKSLSGSSITKIKVQVGKKKTNKKYVKKYKKNNKKKNSGKAVTVTL